MPNKIKKIITKFKGSYQNVYLLVLCLWFRRHFRYNRKRIKGNKNKLYSRNAILNGVKLDIVGDENKIYIDSMAFVDGVTIYVRGNYNNIFIGSECRIKDSIIWIEDNTSEVSIGRLTTIGGAHIAATENRSKIFIGEDCMFAYDIDVRTGDSHGIFDGDGNRINKAQDVFIGNHVWVAAHSIILKGTSVGDGSVVATGAVVPGGGYPANSIVAGNPAKPVRQGIQWTRTRHDNL